MEKIYNPRNIEELIYKFWEKGNYFKPLNNKSSQQNYCIMIPPPNITGPLHLGHAFQQTIMDILIRYQRMQGKNTLWVTGLDHAGIATQILVENQMHADIKNNKTNYTRDEFIKRIWKWKKEYEKIITYQMKRLGNSVYWKYKRFTMDAGMSYSVREAFIKLYQDNLIYKGKKLVNWDPTLQTAISDLEVENKIVKSSMWYIRYKLDPNYLTQKQQHTNNQILDSLIIATTRPETILGDTAVAIHPEDLRYNHLIGKHVITPITNRSIPIIADKHIDMTKGTGCVKITPAHDFNDYIIGTTHDLPMINIFSKQGKILKNSEIFHNSNQSHIPLTVKVPHTFHNLNYYQAREKIISECKQLNLLYNVKTHNSTIPYNYRTGTIIEPMLTDQWYLRTKYLAQQAIDAVQKDIIKFVPEKYKNMYFSWMNNVQDWCISRQIWWGHKIPAWYDNNNHYQIYVGHSEEDIRIQNQLSDNTILYAEQDVLDTWFSSSLWTFSGLGWPNNTHLLNTFHPTNVIVSGFDIIFFWIARMIMLTMYFIKDRRGIPQIPFNTIYITGLVRDKSGTKMSKSKNNTINPLDIIDGIPIENLLKKRTKNILQPQLINKITKYTKQQFPNGIEPHGADALRFTLTALASSGRDIHWDMKRLTGYRNFCNKLWNASKFILKYTQDQDYRPHIPKEILSLPDRWIITKFNITIQQFHQAIMLYRFDKIANILYNFIWHQFCDWYIELVKPTIYLGNISTQQGTRYTLITILESLLRLAHPIIPFITEKIWQEVKIITKNNAQTIMLQPFPKYDASNIDSTAILHLEWIQKVITEIRTIRTNMNIQHNIPLQVIFKNASPQIKNCIQNNYNIIAYMAQLKNINFIEKNEHSPKSINILLDEAELLVLTPNSFDIKYQSNKLQKQIDIINQKIQTIKQTLNNTQFIKKAPEYIIVKHKETLISYKKIKSKLLTQYTIIKKL